MSYSVTERTSYIHIIYLIAECLVPFLRKAVNRLKQLSIFARISHFRSAHHFRCRRIRRWFRNREELFPAADKSWSSWPLHQWWCVVQRRPWTWFPRNPAPIGNLVRSTAHNFFLTNRKKFDSGTLIKLLPYLIITHYFGPIIFILPAVFRIPDSVNPDMVKAFDEYGSRLMLN